MPIPIVGDTLAPDPRDLKALASVLKMHSAFESVNRLAVDWIERGKRELKPEDMESDEKRDWYELSDRWDHAVNNLKQKVSSFEKEYGVSPILAYIPQPNGSTVGWRIFLGYDSRRVYPSSVQARGFRMLQFNDLPVWFEELRSQYPEIFRSENLTEDEVYDLSPPAERLKPEELYVLRDEFLNDLVEARVPAYTLRGEVKVANQGFLDRFNKVVNKRLNYNENIRLLEPLVEQIKREHALAVPRAPGRLAVGPPISPIKVVVPVIVPETGKRLEEWYLMYVPHDNRYVLSYMYRSSWDTKAFPTLDDARAFLSRGRGRLYLHAYRSEEDAVWSYPTPITPFKLPLDKHWENYEADGRHLYHLQQPTWNGIQWIWRITHVYQYGTITRQVDVEAAESELLNNKYGYITPNLAPIAPPSLITAAVPVSAVKISQPGKPLTEEDILSDMPYVNQEPESLDSIIDRLLRNGFDLSNLQQLLTDLIEKEDVFEPKPGFFTWAETEEESEEAEEKEAAAVEKTELEAREIPQEPDQTVYVVVLISGGVPADEQGKMKIETPEFTIEATTKEEFAKYGDFNEEMWLRPFAGMYGVPMLDELLEAGEIEYDAIEDNALVWGDDWDAIREQLADNPPPFNKYAVFHIKWRPEDLHWTKTAADTHDVYHHKYSREELADESKHELQVIAKVKDLSTRGEPEELISRIVGEVPPAVVKEEVAKRCAGDAHILPGAYERFNLPVPKLPEAGFERPLVAVYKCMNKTTNDVISEEYYCDICAAELESNSYPGGAVFPSMWPVRDVEGIICRRSWLPGGEERVKALIARLAPVEKRVEPPFAPKFNVGDIVRDRSSKMESRVLAVYPHHTRPTEGWLYTTEPMDPKLKAAWGKSENMDLEGYNAELVAKAAPKSAADLLAQEALKELAEDALKELREL